MLKVFFGGVALVAVGLLGLNLRIEGGGVLLAVGAVCVGWSAIIGLSAGGKKIEKRLPK